MCERRPFFSIITVCFNAGDALPLAVRGLREQSCGDYEHIIKDGGFTDGSVERVRSLIDGDGRTKVIITLDTVKNKTAPIYELKAPDTNTETEN